MQIVNSYSDQLGNIRLIQQLRLYHLSRPRLRQWRKTRHGHTYQLDLVDQWIINQKWKNLIAVDFAGWYFNDYGINSVCLESDSLSKRYWPNCWVEPDIMTHRPDYLPSNTPVVFKYPWFLKYATQDQFLEFLNTWVQGTTLITFNPMLVQHNHLKYNLLDLIRPRISCKIHKIHSNLWMATP